MTNGERIRRIREANGVSLQEFAEPLGLTAGDILYIEADICPPPEALIRLIERSGEEFSEYAEPRPYTPREAMQEALRLALKEKNLFFALNTANQAFQSYGFSPELGALMDHLLTEAMLRQDCSQLAQIAHAYHRMIAEETASA